jgi:hypothetical protein
MEWIIESYDRRTDRDGQNRFTSESAFITAVPPDCSPSKPAECHLSWRKATLEQKMRPETLVSTPEQDCIAVREERATAGTNVGNSTYCPHEWFYLQSIWVCSFTTPVP